ncbi:hypothetical protein Q5H91_12245 [Sphingomonas sp. KR1UV-12]|uniref:Uncharacterized protein n=1 Tax=Sphingomonas aurea TaxID=3063994 RepID=A0ABT9EM13_9SPHN|nr:hypothetical protein [Sphingomonas sp. KR1UV-12]MDP1027986.1 hypothetical protein [Sphingomonas sp. KR1UV-12]
MIDNKQMTSASALHGHAISATALKGALCMSDANMRKGLGCLTVAPGTAIGLAGLTDGVGPTGWRGLAEVLGWLIVCLAAAGMFAIVLGQKRSSLELRLLVHIGAIGGGCLVYRSVRWLCLDAPMPAKILFTDSVQKIGVAGLLVGGLWTIHAIWGAWRS